MTKKWKPDKERLIELEAMAVAYANEKGFETLRDSIGGAALATSSLIGHLSLFDNKLNESEWLGLVIAVKFLESLAETKK